MTQLVRYRYGTHTHEDGEVVNFRWEELASMTERARRDTATIRATLTVELLACCQTELDTKIEALYTAYTQNDQEFVMEYLDGTPTRYRMDPTSAQCLRGPYVTKLCCLNGDMEEMANKREFLIELEYFYDASESGIISVEESLQVTGFSGPTFNVVPVLLAGGVGALRWFIRWNTTPIVIVQQGRSEGFGGWYDTPAVPLLIGLPGIRERVNERVIVASRPRKIGTTNFRYYPLAWRFVYDADVTVDPMAVLTPYSASWPW